MMQGQRRRRFVARLAVAGIFGSVACGCSPSPRVNPFDAGIDTPSLLALDCNTYCTHLAADCTAANAQFNMTNCMGTCAAYPVGTQADTSGNTLGCRNYHLQNIEVRMEATVTHCPHAGPVGGLVAAATGVCATTTPCDNFCAMEAKVCGTNTAPVTIGVTEITNRYATKLDCLNACAAFDKTTEYSPTVTTGNNFACRIYHLTNAAAQTTPTGVNIHCGHTLSPATSQCI
jgi:hypothetical protein